jgi:hypothetical protein
MQPGSSWGLECAAGTPIAYVTKTDFTSGSAASERVLRKAISDFGIMESTCRLNFPGTSDAQTVSPPGSSRCFPDICSERQRRRFLSHVPLAMCSTQ